jgi:hypothetical protein
VDCGNAKAEEPSREAAPAFLRKLRRSSVKLMTISFGGLEHLTLSTCNLLAALPTDRQFRLQKAELGDLGNRR